MNSSPVLPNRNLQDKLLIFLRFFIGWPISILALFFIVKFIIPQSQTITKGIQITTLPLVFAVLCFLLYYLIRSYLWKKLLQRKGYDMPFKEVSFLWSMAELKRFVPGNIWSFLGKSTAFSQEGIGKKDIAHLLLIEIEFFILACLVISLFSISFILEEILLLKSYSVFIIPSVTAVVLVVSLIFLFNKKINMLQTGFIKYLLPDFASSDNAVFLIISITSVFFFGLGTYLTMVSIVFLSLKSILLYIGFFVLSLLIGYVSFITPMGLGIREGVITVGLTKLLTFRLAGFAAIYSRIILVLSEILFLVFTFAWHKMKNKIFLKTENYVREYSREIVLGILIILYIFYFTSASFLRYDNFYTGRFDLGNMDQTVWNTTHGRIFTLTDPNGTNIISRLAFHADFILILISPLYFIWSHPKMLLVLQSVVLGLGAIFIYLLARSVLKNKNLSLVLSLAYLINPLVGFVNLYDFHPVALTTTFFLGAFYFLKQKKYILFLIFLILASIAKEQVWVITGLIGLYVFFVEKKRALGTGIAIASFAIFYYLVWQAIPTALGGKHFALSYYSDFGESPTKIVGNIIFSPQKTLLAVLQREQLLYLLNIFLPLGFLSFLNPITLIFSFPDLLINLLSKNTQLQKIYYQYSSSIIPFLFISAIYGVNNLKKRLPKISANIYISYVIFFAFLSAYLLGPLPGTSNPNINMFINQQPNREIIDDYLSSIPAKFSIAATNNVGSHLSHRQKIFTIPVGIDKADIIVFLLNDPFAQPSLKAQKEIAKKMENDKNYIEVFKEGDFIVFEKRDLYLESGRKKIHQIKLFPLSISSLSHRNYEGGTISIEGKVDSSGLFSSYLISYPSDGLKIYALMNIPKSPKPENGYPVLIVNHGYIDPKEYNTITSYKGIADYFSSHGFLVLKPDYRGNGKSEIDNKALMRFTYPIDVMNLITSIGNIDEANKNNISLWGHSMGGEVTLETLEIIGKNPDLSKSVKAAILWAPVIDPIRWFSKSHLSQLPEMTIRPFPYSETFKILGTPDQNPALWQSLSPLSYLSDIQTPIQIDHGTSDETVPYEWSIELYNDLKTLGKKTDLNLYPDSDHNIQPLFNKAAKDSLDFLEENK